MTRTEMLEALREIGRLTHSVVGAANAHDARFALRGTDVPRLLFLLGGIAVNTEDAIEELEFHPSVREWEASIARR